MRVCLAVAVLLIPAVLEAQIGGAQLTGIVRDADGAPIGGATIIATSANTGATRTTTSTSAGVYTLPALSAGPYRVQFELAGFKQVRRDGLRLQTGETVRLDVLLDVAGVNETVMVPADASPLRATGSIGHVVAKERVEALPLNGRTFIALAALVPGVALPPASQLPRINGGRPRTNEYLFDGISVLQPEPGQVAYFPVIDAIQEFKIETNSPPAEFGRFNGGVVNLTTKAGGNVFHGAGFEFLRHEVLNARNVFQSTSPV